MKLLIDIATLMHAFGKGSILGIAMAAPIGPICILCIRRSLAHGVLTGLATGAGASVADAVYGLIAVCGLTIISNLFMAHHTIIQTASGLLLCYLGIKTLLQSSQIQNSDKTTTHHETLWCTFLTSFLLAMTNPMTFLLFAAAFSSMGTLETTHQLASALFIMGVLMSSFVWYCLLSVTAAFVDTKLPPTAITLIDTIAGGALLLLGSSSLVKLVA